MQALTYLLRLRVQQLLRHLLPGKAEIARHRDRAQADAASRRKQERPGIAIAVLRGEVGGYCFVGEVAGSDDVRKRGATLPGKYPPAEPNKR
jgi:hypothetical protein